MTLGNQSCRHDGRCFRRNHQHFLDFCHPREARKPRCPALIRLEVCTDQTHAHVSAFTHCPPIVELDRVQRGLDPLLRRPTPCGRTPATTATTATTTTTTTTTKTTLTTATADSAPPLPQGGGKLRENFIVPPFSILDAKQGPWQARKREWLNLGIDSGAGRDEALLGEGLSKLSPGLTGTSIFDPVLAEVALRWFCPRPTKGGPPVVVVDPFAGGSVRGIVAAKLGLCYFGVDLSARQVAANRAQAKDVCGDCEHAPSWVVGDGADIVALFAQWRDARGLASSVRADCLLTCPPYFDLECYGGDARQDLSMMAYSEFVDAYTRILASATSLLHHQCVAVVVVGNMRSSTGELRDLHSLTKAALAQAGNPLYVDAVLSTALASAPQRAGRQMSAASKLVGVHQSVVVTCKDKVLDAKACTRLGIQPGASA